MKEPQKDDVALFYSVSKDAFVDRPNQEDGQKDRGSRNYKFHINEYLGFDEMDKFTPNYSETEKIISLQTVVMFFV